ncbi:aspartate/glutamate racemase family protein [Acinetobacter sp. 187]|uniref:aspartate/glutamate racemase family protein n=1 Tax=Acinetobacter lanii TaxID=2715163 RepID=UPI001409EEB6|nr:aspartate/glutamate racemase family protein [Acinetobacter lanii]NHC02508.1 aspartate/glutamate racemase family protein [Acinetobacter lanii]
MKTIGLIGGMSWESSVVYYQQINQLVQQRLGGLNSAKIILYSLNFHEIERLQYHGEWEQAGEMLADIAKHLEEAGADAIVLCTNTMHKVANHIQRQIDKPFLHIAESTLKALQAQKLYKVGLLGTAFTMQQDFYKQTFLDAGIDILIPHQADRLLVHEVIYQELCKGIIRFDSKARFKQIIEKLHDEGAEGVILGCTEIGLLIHSHDSPIPVFNTTQLHICDIVDFILT